ncbi:MAG TPA: glucokinase [Candidatus Acidoferrum sp.]|nr:glucokinase [Candidatus Acidoferrum sp.]
MILAGDIGGTKCNLAVFQEHGSSLQLLFKRRYATNEFSSLENLIERFFRECAAETGVTPEGNVDAAGFGVAGAVVDGRLVANNIPWELTASALAGHLNLDIEQLALINDLVATAYGLVHLAPQDFLVLNAGAPQFNGNQALIAAGTGLGEAMILWDGKQHHASPSEGGAADFAPRTEREIQLLHFLKKRLPRVSCEEIFSGRGFRKLHEFLDPTVVHETFHEAEGASASEITQNALAGTCPVCVEVLDWWIDAFGAEAGNLALRVLAYGGVYFAGGIVLKILSKLEQSSFCRAFADKGRLSAVLSKIPISVVLNEDAPLLGAAYQALGTIGASRRERHEILFELQPLREGQPQ